MRYVKCKWEIKVFDGDNYIGAWTEYQDGWYWRLSNYSPTRFLSPENMTELLRILEEANEDDK